MQCRVIKPRDEECEQVWFILCGHFCTNEYVLCVVVGCCGGRMRKKRAEAETGMWIEGGRLE